jgi:hypothetical protein
MKLKILTDKNEIAKYQKYLKAKFISASSFTINGDVGYQGESASFKIHYLDKPNIWAAFDKLNNRYWNAFGINEPVRTTPNSIRSEINIPYDGLHGAAGRLAKDYRNNVYLLHTGRIGGGQPGIGKTLFRKKYKGKIFKIRINNKIEEFVNIDKLKSKSLIDKIGAFVWAVHSIKTNKKIYPPTFEINKAIRQFKREFSGKKHYLNELSISAKCDHGKVVNALYKILKKKTRLLKKDITNNKNVDLFVFDKLNKKIALFEIKTKINTTNLYQAVGQLLVNASFEKNSPKLYVVLPSNYLEKNLKKIGINTVSYNLRGSKIKFKGIPTL